MNIKKPSSVSIEKCINNLTEDGIWKPLPEREAEIDYINEFIENSFVSDDPLILIVSGPKLCGKTAVLHTCSLMSDFEDMIFFFDCIQNNIFDFQNLPDDDRKLIVLDNFALKENIDLVHFFYELNFSIIVVIQQHEKNDLQNIINILQDSGVFASSIRTINFGRYDRNKIKNILNEYMKETYDIVPSAIISSISVQVEKNEESIQDAFQVLHNYLQNNNTDEPNNQ